MIHDGDICDQQGLFESEGLEKRGRGRTFRRWAVGVYLSIIEDVAARAKVWYVASRSRVKQRKPSSRELHQTMNNLTVKVLLQSIEFLAQFSICTPMVRL